MTQVAVMPESSPEDRAHSRLLDWLAQLWKRQSAHTREEPRRGYIVEARDSALAQSSSVLSYEEVIRTLLALDTFYISAGDSLRKTSTEDLGGRNRSGSSLDEST